MNRRERLMATLRGDPVDRPPVSFYELNGLDENPDDDDPFNIYTDPSWRPLIDLTRDKTDRIVMRAVPMLTRQPAPLAALTHTESSTGPNGSQLTRQTIRIGGHVLTSLARRDRDVNTTWTLEPLLKTVDDLNVWLSIPPQEDVGEPDVSDVLSAEAQLGDTGIVMIDTPDPLCLAAELFSMADFTVIASTEPRLFRQVLDRFAASLQARTEAVARALPGRLWRIYGPEYASPPYLRPALFREYVVPYDTALVSAIHATGGFARLHCHGRLKTILDDIVATGCMALDPIEPPPQGDVTLRYVRERYGDRLVLFGNLEVSDIELLPTDQFAHKVRQALREGTAGAGRGFVLMPSACPYGRHLAPLTVRNYEKIVDIVEQG